MQESLSDGSKITRNSLACFFLFFFYRSKLMRTSMERWKNQETLHLKEPNQETIGNIPSTNKVWPQVSFGLIAITEGDKEASCHQGCATCIQ